MTETSCTGEPECPDAVVARGLCRRHYGRWWRTGNTDAPLTQTVSDRFWAKVNKSGPTPAHRPELGPCWVFQDKADRGGYGRFWDGTFYRPGRPRTVQAHRWAFRTYVGDPGPLQVLHRCDNRLCVRYDTHLFAGTHADNMADRDAKGRHAHGEGHPDAKLTREQVLEIRAASSSQRELARQYGVDKATIGRILRRQTWKHL